MKIAVMDSPVVSPLLAHVDAVCAELGWTVIRDTEEGCGRRLFNNEVELALVSPLGYAKGVGRVDYRIVPGPCVALSDYTETAGIVFKENVDEIASIAADNPGSYLAFMGFVILREKFEATADTIEQADAGSTCVITESDAPSWTLDISEEWFDMAEALLPIAVWVCRTEADLDKVASAVQRMAQANLADADVVEHSESADETFPRQGKIVYRWSDEVEEALEAVMNVLYFHQRTSELPAVKVLGREEL